MSTHRTGGSAPLGPLEAAALVQAGAMVVLATWGFGGNAPWAHRAMTWWGTGGIAITVLAALNRNLRTAGRLRPLRWLIPFVCFNGLVLASLLNPSFRAATMGAEILLVKTGGRANLPSSAQPRLAADALWLFDGMFLSAFNIALLVRRRRHLRTLLLACGANALALAVFGSVQKLLGSTGLYFGLFPSPQKSFFASFIYHNHWSAFALLSTAVCLGLVVRYARRPGYRDFWHSPAFGGLVMVFFLAASIPLSTSRSGTLLVLILLGGAGIHTMARTLKKRRALGESAVKPLGVGIAVALIAGAAAYKIAEPSILLRIAKTEEQVSAMREQGTIGSRLVLYRDTWHMAKDKLPFGWGMASYPTVFYLYNTQESKADRLPVFYWDAHSDILQALAEHGVAGTTLLGLLALVPLATLRLRHLQSPLPVYLLAGCALVLGYALIEFPFGNPAVVFTWWLSFFCAVRYARLESPTERLSE